jgi:radical SAM superfamily enzyme YgiQ (UPF0313 family)
MKIKFILPALEEATSPFWRPIKYSLFPPLGLATLAAYCREDDELTLEDEHIEAVCTDDSPDLVCIETYITNAHRAYEIADAYRARGIHVALGGLHATALPQEALLHADTVVSGLGERSFPLLLRDLRKGNPQPFYREAVESLDGIPLPRRDLIKREKYLVPNSMVFSRGCPNRCSFCYVDSFYRGGKSFYAYRLERILEEIATLPGRHLYFLDDNLFADKKLCLDLFREMRGMGRLFQGAVTVKSILDGNLMEEAYAAGYRSAFVGFESMNEANLAAANKQSNLGVSYAEAVRRLDSVGIMINGSFIFGMDGDDAAVFDTTARWAVESGVTTATFHILTPYPGTKLYDELNAAGRVENRNWQEYDTRHLVFKHPNISKEVMEEGYKHAYREFYRWRNIRAASAEHEKIKMRLKHLTYAGAWKKFEPVWNFVIKFALLGEARKILERTLK